MIYIDYSTALILGVAFAFGAGAVILYMRKDNK